MNLFDGKDAVCTVTPLSAAEHAYMQREAERRKNDPPDEITTCIHCGNVIDLEDEGDEAICVDCAEERLASQHADAADRRRDERWADQWDKENDRD